MLTMLTLKNLPPSSLNNYFFIVDLVTEKFCPIAENNDIIIASFSFTFDVTREANVVLIKCG